MQGGNELKEAYKKQWTKLKKEAYKEWYNKMGTEEGERVIYKVEKQWARSRRDIGK